MERASRGVSNVSFFNPSRENKKLRQWTNVSGSIWWCGEKRALGKTGRKKRMRLRVESSSYPGTLLWP